MKVSDLHIRIRYEGGELKTEMISDLDRAGRKTDDLKLKSRQTEAAWTKAGLASTIALTGMTILLHKAVQAAADLEDGVGEIMTLMDNPTSAIRDQLTQDIVGLGVASGETFGVLQKSLYDIKSAGFTEAADSAKIWNTAVKLGIGGASDTAQATDLLTTALNAYGLSADESMTVSDMLFTIVKKGKTTIDELSGSLGNVLPGARAAKLDLAGVGAALATLTAAGLNTPIAVTSLNSALRNLAAPAAEAQTAMRDAGIEVSYTDEGMLDLLETIRQFQGMDLQAVMQIIPREEAAKGVLALANNFAVLEANTAAFAETSGITEQAYSQMADNFNRNSQRMQNSIAGISVEIGESFIPMMNDAFDSLLPVTEGLRKWADENPKLTAGLVSSTIALAAFTSGWSAWVLMAPRIIAAFRAIQASMGPGGWLILGLSLVAGLLVAYSSGTDAAAERTRKFAEAQAELNEAMQAGNMIELERAMIRYRALIRNNELALQALQEKLSELNEQQKKNYSGRLIGAGTTSDIFRTQKEIAALQADIEGYVKLLDQAKSKQASLLSGGGVPGDTGGGGSAAVEEAAGFQAASDLAERMLRVKLQLAQTDAERIEIYQALLELQRAEMEMAEAGSEEWISAMEEAVALEEEIQGFKDELREEEIAKQEESAARQAEIDEELHQGKLARLQALQAASDTFWQTMLDVEMSGASRNAAIWRAMAQVALRAISKKTIAWIAGEKTATAASAAGAAGREGVENASFISSMAKDIKTIGARVFSFYASMGPFGIPLAAATIVSMLAAIKSLKFAEGGVVDEATLALLGERNEREFVVPERNFRQVFNEDLLPDIMREVKLQAQVVLSGGGGGNVSNVQENRQVNYHTHQYIIEGNVLGGEDALTEVIRTMGKYADQREAMK